MSEKQQLCWIPLESNPEVLNQLFVEFGLPATFQISDLYGLDKESLAFVPQPVLSLLLLYPLSEKVKQYYVEEEDRQKGLEISPFLYFIKQTVRNSCGTIAAVHALANNLDRVPLGNGPLKAFLQQTNNSTPDKRAQFFEKFAEIGEIHARLAKRGQTLPPDEAENVDLHFVTFVEKDGNLYELDGRKPKPFNHGPTSRETFLKDAAAICRKIISQDPSNLRFTVMALSPQ